ncbi:MAG: hemW [Sphingobacteriaceae bacterium]|nr:hemW [Sphingobacteriaceae bacterium]
MIKALLAEIALQKSYLNGQNIETIYFGGGTPSILKAEEIGLLIDEITKHHSVSSDAEITLEANPDDLDAQKVKELKQTGVNRFSIGVQSFFEEDLRWMNRAHNASEAESSIMRVQDAGFENITIDLIYGYPLLSDEKWKSNLDTAIGLQIPHISSYALTVEEKTVLASFIRKGKQQPVNEEQSAAQFIQLTDTLQEAGYEHYEISNFAKPGKYSRHNSNYWKGVPYLGIGPSAHSFNAETRQWNVKNNSRYIEELGKGNVPSETEVLTEVDRVNEYIMTSIRTMWGMGLQRIATEFGTNYSEQIRENLDEAFDKDWIKEENQTITLTQTGKLFADHIAATLFVSEPQR